MARCRKQQLDARLLNYRNLPPDWQGAFNGLAANGSLEHFVSVDDAAAGRDNERYAEFFAICRRLVSAGCRLATTAIHFRQSGQVRPEEMQRGPYAFDRSDPRYHFAMVLEQTFGGWYPAPGQLESCTRGRFRLVREVDGTRDYDRTSQYWLQRLKRSLLLNPLVWAGLAGKLLRYPQPALDMLRCQMVDQSWSWQFRGDPAPPSSCGRPGKPFDEYAAGTRRVPSVSWSATSRISSFTVPPVRCSAATATRLGCVASVAARDARCKWHLVNGLRREENRPLRPPLAGGVALGAWA